MAGVLNGCKSLGAVGTACVCVLTLVKAGSEHLPRGSLLLFTVSIVHAERGQRSAYFLCGLARPERFDHISAARFPLEPHGHKYAVLRSSLVLNFTRVSFTGVDGFPSSVHHWEFFCCCSFTTAASD